MKTLTLENLADDLLKRCPLCGLDRLASEGDNDCMECFERKVEEHRALLKLDNKASKILDSAILPIGFDWMGW